MIAVNAAIKEEYINHNEIFELQLKKLIARADDVHFCCQSFFYCAREASVIFLLPVQFCSKIWNSQVLHIWWKKAFITQNFGFTLLW